jgi:hypothetical protein
MIQDLVKEVEQMDYLRSKAREYVKWRIDLDMWDPGQEDEEVGEKVCEWVSENVELTSPDTDMSKFEDQLDKFWQQVEEVKRNVKGI